MKNSKVFIKSILVPVIIGGIVGIIISKYINYSDLNKPFLSPPAILFPIIWTILYILMGVSYGILKYNDNNSFIYYLQLFFNALWPILFFVLNFRLFSFFWIVILTLLVIIMTIDFYKKNKIAGLLQIPYVIWRIFATYLNLGIYLLNK